MEQAKLQWCLQMLCIKKLDRHKVLFLASFLKKIMDKKILMAYLYVLKMKKTKNSIFYNVEKIIGLKILNKNYISCLSYQQIKSYN